MLIYRQLHRCLWSCQFFYRLMLCTSLIIGVENLYFHFKYLYLCLYLQHLLKTIKFLHCFYCRLDDGMCTSYVHILMQQDNLKSNKHGCTDTKPVRIKVFHRITPPPKVHFSIKWIENSVTHHYNFSYNCRDSMNSRHHLGKKLVDFFFAPQRARWCMHVHLRA
jgi:hypothetical protein